MASANRRGGTPDGHSFARTECFRALDSCFSFPLVSVAAGGGYGKTTLINNYLVCRGIPSIWYNRYPKGDLSDFTGVLSAGLTQLHPNLSLPEGEIGLLETCAHWDGPLAIVVDDFYLSESAPFRDFLLQLSKHASPTVTTVVISRKRPSFPYTKLKIQHQLAEITEQQLQFSRCEIKDYFQLNGLVLKEHELDLVHTRTGGWPAALPLILEVWKGKDSTSRRWEYHKFPFSELIEELEPDLLSLSPDVSESFLYETSILHEFVEQNRSFFSDALPIDWPSNLIKQRFLISKNENGNDAYLPLFRMYLYEKLLRQRGKKSVRDLHTKAAEHYETLYQYYYAFAHFLAADKYGEAARVMQKMMNIYTPERFVLLLDGSLKEICPSISNSLYSHFLFRSVPVPILQGYIKPFMETLEGLKAKGLSSSVVLLEHHLGIILYYSGDIDGALSRFLSSYEGSVELGDPELVSINLALAAQCCRFSDKIADGVIFAKKALTHIETEGSFDSRMHATWVLTELLLEQHQLDLAEPLVGELLRLADEYDDEGARVYPLIAVGKYFRLIGDYTKALDYGKRGLAEARKFNLDTDLGWGYMELGLIHSQTGNHTVAADYLEKSRVYFSHYKYFHSLATTLLKTIKEKGSTSQNGDKELDPSPPAGKTDALSIKILGQFSLQSGGKPITIPRKTSLRLFLYLASQPGLKIPKDMLLEELFPDGNFSSQNNRFYVTLSTLRKALEPNLKSARLSNYIIQSGELFYLDHTKCKIDVEDFTRLITPMKEESNEDSIERLKRAVSLYKGDLLAEFPYEQFLESARERTRQSFIKILQEIGDYYWSIHDTKQAMDYYDLLILHDEYAEGSYWRYLERLLTNSHVAHAMKIASKMEKSIEGELGIPVKDRLKVLFAKYDVSL